MDKAIRSYRIHDQATLVITSPRYFDIKYVQAYINVWGVPANGSLIDVPIGPPLPDNFQVFQFRMTSESHATEFSIHAKPYEKCKAIDWLFRCQLDHNDEMCQETWLVKPDNSSLVPFLFFSFKELAGVNPGQIRLEMRLAN